MKRKYDELNRRLDSASSTAQIMAVLGDAMQRVQELENMLFGSGPCKFCTTDGPEYEVVDNLAAAIDLAEQSLTMAREQADRDGFWPEWVHEVSVSVTFASAVEGDDGDFKLVFG